jgi:predicted dehydrogenase
LLTVPKSPAYIILGRGRWAQKVHPILAAEGKHVRSIEQARQLSGESETAYVERLSERFKASGAQIAWLCVAPGHHVSLMVQAALQADLHIIVEKPWYGTPEETQRLQAQAHAKGRVIAVHFEYLVLEEVEKWRVDCHPGAGLLFRGHFFLSRADHSGIPAIANLGCHLLAIREFAVPSSDVAEIACGYQLPDERQVWLDRGNRRVASIDLLTHRQPIIQRFLQKVEAALDGAAFPFDLQFALRVAGALDAYKRRGPA